MQMKVANPKVIMFTNERGEIETRIHPALDEGFEVYGILAADLIRHIARCFGVDESQIMHWINKEIAKPTSPIEGGLIQRMQ